MTATIYLDNGATSYPKPREVLDRMFELYSAHGVSPGRGGYDLALEAEELVSAARKNLGEFFGGDDPTRVIFAYNATDALNTLIQGLATPGSHVVSSRLEHNSVLRPLHALKERGIITYDLVPFDRAGRIDPGDVSGAIQSATRFVILTHASNALGTVQPVEEIGALCRRRGVPLLLDVTQSAGLIPIEMKRWGVSGIAFTGHKSLLGPTGIGGLVLSRDLDPPPTRFGGTGLDSGSLVHSRSYPHRLEAGTINILGVIGLAAGLDYIRRNGMEQLLAREMSLAVRLRDGIQNIPGVRLYCADPMKNHLPLLLMNIDGLDPEGAAAVLDGDFGIAARAGLHCAPLVHEDLGTAPNGALRFSLGPLNTADQIDKTVEAIRVIAQGRKSG
jgi:cysteine desulfurase/selenocysteine lyase